ncbi:hypothetical protein [Streptosporangium sp. NPDC001681]|uniref:hypothetical protein n=1 Tax=Streptosporangium sp. NPDC001681 TaxID=3154395 RepID=UPI003317DE63
MVELVLLVRYLRDREISAGLNVVENYKRDLARGAVEDRRTRGEVAGGGASGHWFRVW